MLSTSYVNVNRNESQRILVLFPGSLGDLICALPAIEAVSKGNLREITLAVRGEAFELCLSLPFVANVCSLEGRVFSHLFSSSENLPEETCQFFSSFSEILSWYGHSYIEVLEKLRLLSSGRLRSFSFFTGQEEDHAAKYYLRCVDRDTLCCPSLKIPKSASRWGELYWRQHEWDIARPILILHPGSGGKRKRWDAEGFRRIAGWWRQHQHRKVLILLGPAEEKEAGDWKAVGEVVSGLFLWQTAALLSRADLYLGNDSGVSHLAGAVGARGAVLFGPTQPQKWRPLGGSLSVVQNAVYRATFPAGERISLEEISEEEVIARLILQGG